MVSPLLPKEVITLLVFLTFFKVLDVVAAVIDSVAAVIDSVVAVVDVVAAVNVSGVNSSAIVDAKVSAPGVILSIFDVTVSVTGVASDVISSIFNVTGINCDFFDFTLISDAGSVCLDA